MQCSTEACGHLVEEVAMFLTSATGLLNRTEKWVWIPGGLRPLRRHAPVNGINKTADGRKLNRQHERMLQGWERVIAKALLQLIHSPSLTPLASCLLSLQNTCCVQALSLTFPNIDPLPHLRPYDWTVFLSRLEDYLKSCRVADLYRFMCFYLFIFSSDTTLELLSNPEHHHASLNSHHPSSSVPLPVTMVVSLKHVCNIRDRPNKPASLSRRVTNLAYIACGTVNRNEKKLRHLSQTYLAER